MDSKCSLVGLRFDRDNVGADNIIGGGCKNVMDDLKRWLSSLSEE